MIGLIMVPKSNRHNIQTMADVVALLLLTVLSLLVPVVADPSSRHPNQRELRYVVEEELMIGFDIADVADDAGLVDRYGPAVARSSLRFRFLATPRVPVAVDELTGRIRTTGRLDREAICGDGGDNMELCLDRLDVAVQPMNYFQIIKVSLEILDVNDNPPEFPSSSVVIELSESSAVGTAVTVDSATDRDTTQFAVTRYQLVPHDEPAAAHFKLKTERKLDGSTDVQLVLTRALDRESRDFYKVKVVAWDGGSPPRSGTVDVSVMVLDANDHGPVFEHSSYEVTVAENIEIGTTVAKVSAFDADDGINAEVEYFMSSSTLSSQAGQVFDVDQLTGDVTVVGQVDREVTPVYRLLISARDRGVDSASSNSADAIVVVRVGDENDNSPTISINTLLQASGSADVARVPECEAEDTFVAHVVVSDPDEGRNGRFDCTLDGGGGGAENNFRLTTVGDGEYQLLTAAMLDREGSDEYHLSVICEDGGQPPRVSSAELLVQVSDVNDHRPQFEQEEYSTDLVENNYIGAVVLTVKAVDADDGDNAKLVYRLLDNHANESSQFDSSPFSVDPATGVIRATASVDREVKEVYQFHVTAADAGSPIAFTSTVLVTVNVLDVNDEAPRFKVSSYSLGLDENLPAGTEVAVLEAFDRDSDPFNRFVFNFRSDGGPGMDAFSIDNVTGRVTTSRVLDREQHEVYKLMAVVRDVHQSTLSSTASVTIFIVDANDHAPVWVVPSNLNTTLVRVSSYTAVGAPVARVRAVDADDGDNARLTYSTTVSGGEPPDYRLPFDVDPDSGIVRLRYDLSTTIVDDNNVTFELELTATDHGDPPRSTANSLTLTFVVSRLIFPAAADGTATGRRRAGAPLIAGWVPVAVAAACALGLVLLCTVLAVLACVVRRRRRDCTKRHPNSDASAMPLTGKYNCRVESLKVVSVCDTNNSNQYERHLASLHHQKKLAGSLPKCDVDDVMESETLRHPLRQPAAHLAAHLATTSSASCDSQLSPAFNNRQLCKSSSSSCGLTPCTLPQCSAASLNYCNSLCTLRPTQHNGRHPVIDIRPTTIKYSGAVADKWYVSLPPQVHLPTVKSLGEDGESTRYDVSSDVTNDVMEPPCYCQQEQQQGAGQYELLKVT